MSIIWLCFVNKDRMSSTPNVLIENVFLELAFHNVHGTLLRSGAKFISFSFSKCLDTTLLWIFSRILSQMIFFFSLYCGAKTCRAKAQLISHLEKLYSTLIWMPVEDFGLFKYFSREVVKHPSHFYVFMVLHALKIRILRTA